MSELRSRPQQQSPSPKSDHVVGDEKTRCHRSTVKSSLSPQSFNAIRGSTSCPTKVTSFNVNNKINNTLPSRMLRRCCRLRLNLTTIFYLGLALSIGLQYVALRSVVGGNNHNDDEYSSKYIISGPKSNIRRRSESRHPRITYHIVTTTDLSNLGSSTFWKRLTLFIPLRNRSTIYDPMLHRDGWVVTTTAATTVENSFDEKSDDCVPMVSWQETSYPNCNSIHEIDLVLSSGQGSNAFPPLSNAMTAATATAVSVIQRRWLTKHPWQHLKNQDYLLRKRSETAELSPMMGIIKQEDITFLGQGWFRAAWRMDFEGPEVYDEEEEEYVHKESVVLKTLRYERDFLEEYYELHRRDALAMERMTASPYVLDVYGYCGQSAINELANFGFEGMTSLESVAKGFRGLDIEQVSKIKLQLATMVAQGVSHLHSIDYPDFQREDYRGSGPGSKQRAISNATLIHYDLNPRNIAIMKRGKPKLNDFNVAILPMWNPKTNTKCGFQGRFHEPWWRAPEEMQVQMTEYDDPTPLTEKVDVYSLGNTLWNLLTTHAPWGKMTKERQEEVRSKVAKGELPELPPPYHKLTLKDPALKAIKDAMYKCLRLNPVDRPSAGEIAEELADALENLPKGFGDKNKFKEEMEKLMNKQHN